MNPYPESVISLYPHGLQLETHRGIQASFFTPSISLFVTRKFIATPMILDVILNEGLRRWNFHYYLAIICRARENLTEPVIIHVAYPVRTMTLVFFILTWGNLGT